MDGESGFEEAEVSEVSAGVTKVITRFIEKVRASALVNMVPSRAF